MWGNHCFTYFQLYSWTKPAHQRMFLPSSQSCFNWLDSAVAPRRALIRFALFHLRNVVGDLVLVQHRVPVWKRSGERHLFLVSVLGNVLLVSTFFLFVILFYFYPIVPPFMISLLLALATRSQDQNFNSSLDYASSSLFYFSTIIFPCPSFCLSYRNCQPHLTNLSHASVLIWQYKGPDICIKK